MTKALPRKATKMFFKIGSNALENYGINVCFILVVASQFIEE